MKITVARVLAFSGVSVASLLLTTAPSFAQEASTDRSETQEAAPDQSKAKQTTAPSGKDSIGEIVVTATRRAVNVQDVPSAISVLSGDAVEQYQLTTFTDLARLDPALQFASRGVGDSRIIVRGIQSGGVSTVALYLDEAVITGQNIEYASGGGQPDIGLHDIARVEVLKGPQGTLFGASSMAGTVRIITNKPDLDEVSGSIHGIASFGANTNPLYETEGVINLPVVTDVAGVRVAGWYSDGGGYIDSVSSGKSDINDAEVKGLRGTVLLRPSDRLSLTVAGTYQKIGVDGAQEYKRSLGAYNNDSPTTSPYDEELYLISGVGEYDLGFGSITAATSYLWRHQTLFSDTTPTATGFGLPGYYNIFDNSKRSIWSNELRFASDFDGPFQIVFGGNYQREENDYQNVIGQVPKDTGLGCSTFAGCREMGIGTSIVSARDVSSPFSSHAIFGEAEFKPLEKLTLTAGLRRFNSRQHNIEYTLQTLRFPDPDPASVQNEPILAVDLAVKQSKTSYNFAATYEPSSALTLYARAASGFRQGGVNNSAFAANFDTEIPDSYGPDEIWNYEVGIKGSLFDDLLSFEAAAYHIDWTDQQVPAVSSNAAFTFTTNAGRSVVNGVEMQGTLRPARGLSISVGGTYTDSHLTEDQPPTEGDETAPGVAGDRLPYVAKWVFSGSIEYTRPIGRFEAYARANANYRGRAYTFFNNANPYYTDVGDYMLADLAAGVKFDNFEVGLLVRNLTNEKAILSIFPGPDGFRVSTVRPRNIGLSLRANF